MIIKEKIWGYFRVESESSAEEGTLRVQQGVWIENQSNNNKNLSLLKHLIVKFTAGESQHTKHSSHLQVIYSGVSLETQIQVTPNTLF